MFTSRLTSRKFRLNAAELSKRLKEKPSKPKLDFLDDDEAEAESPSLCLDELECFLFRCLVSSALLTDRREAILLDDLEQLEIRKDKKRCSNEFNFQQL